MKETSASRWFLRVAFTMLRSVAPVLFTLILCLGLLKGDVGSSCQLANNRHDLSFGRYPVTFTSNSFIDTHRFFEEVTFGIWMTAEDFCEISRVEIEGKCTYVVKLVLKRSYKHSKCAGGIRHYTNRICKNEFSKRLFRNNSSSLHQLVFRCCRAQAGRNISLTYTSNSTSSCITYQVADPMPDYSLDVNKATKQITVTANSAETAIARLCYKKSSGFCSSQPGLTSELQEFSQSATFNITYLLPCLCVEVYYTHRDAKRNLKCPFEEGNLLEADDVQLSADVTLYDTHIEWRHACPPGGLNISASLCWKLKDNLCVPVPNSQLMKTKVAGHLDFSTDGIDKHPQMCVKFSIENKHNISCLFHREKPSWESSIEPISRYVAVHLNPSAAGNFSAQLCDLTERGCKVVGPVHSVTMSENTRERSIKVPVHLSEIFCVQVWKSDPLTSGRRTLCWDNTRNRNGTLAVAGLLFVVVVTFLGLSVRHLVKNVTEEWLVVLKPLLLVLSSDQSAHVSAGCALASVLHLELGNSVRTALWDLISDKQEKSRAGVADLGPGPWLYGQWEAVCRAQGKVLIVWSCEARRIYDRWKRDIAYISQYEIKPHLDEKVNVTRALTPAEVEQQLKSVGKRLKRLKKSTAVRKHNCVKKANHSHSKYEYSEKEHSTVIKPVFLAAMTSLETALRDCKGQQVAIVYFQGHCHNRDIPKELKGLSCYCLPPDFSGLIQELAPGGEHRGHHWKRLIWKLFSRWLARVLTRRLRAAVRRMEELEAFAQSVPSDAASTQKHSKFKLKTKLGDQHERELLQGSPWRPMES